MRRLPFLPRLLLLAAPFLMASGAELGPTLLALTVLLVASKVGADVAARLGQPAVLGELLAGVVLGNLDLLGWRGLDFVVDDALVAGLAELGVIVLLFEVGLESTLGQMARVGWSSLRVAVLGVVAPFVLGWGVGAWLLPEHSSYMHAFLGATLTATSVGITARVLRDLGRSDSLEARVILGAAVIDDVLGLIILAAVTGVIAAADAGQGAGGGGGFGAVAWITFKAFGFLGVALLVGARLTPRVFEQAARLRAPGVLLGISLGFCFLLAWASAAAGLAPIVGAFAAGLLLENAHFEPFRAREPRPLEELVQPISAFLAPVFFMRMGMRVDLGTFADTSVLGLGAALIGAAIVGKQVCALGVWEPGIRRLPVGVGMIPRGEVGLIFANIGLTLRMHGEPMVDASVYAAVVVMVIVTTLVTPPLLAAALGPSPRTPAPDPR